MAFLDSDAALNAASARRAGDDFYLPRPARVEGGCRHDLQLQFLWRKLLQL